MASLLRFAYVMALRRTMTGWRLEAVLFGSILLAVALMASGVIFSQLLANAALRGELVQAQPQDVNFWIRSFSSRDDPLAVEGRRRAFQARDSFVTERVAAPLQPYLKEQARHLETATFFFEGHPHLELDNDIRPRGPLVHLTGIDDRIRVLEGRWPVGAGAPRQPVEVAVDKLGAELLQLEVGGTMGVFPAASFAEPPVAQVRIAGIFEQVDPSDEFWYGLASASSRDDDRWTLIPLFASEDALIEQVLGTYPALYTDTTWYFFPDRKRVRADDLEEVQQHLTNAERSAVTGLSNSSYSIRLDNLLRSFDEQLLLARVPLLLVIFLVTGVLVYYLALVAGLIVRSRAGEIAMLKSRGATTLQLGILGLGEGLLLAAPAVVIGPFLALGVVRLLGFIFFELSGASETLVGVPVGLTLGPFLLGLAGGGLAVVVFTVATLAAARHGTVEARQAGARPPTTSFLHRYYLDLVLLVLIGLLWWQLQSRGAFLVQSLGTRELSIDYSLLLGPVLGLMAAGLIVLRLFPWAAAALARLAGPVGPTWLVHVLRQLARDPMTPAMLIVLVMLATALGVMGSAFSSTLERGQEERALYAAGADLRLQHSGWNQPGNAAGLADSLNGLDDVAAASAVFRAPGYVTTTGFSTSGTLLAVDADTIDEVAWFRGDFADGRSLASLAGQLKAGSVGAPPDGILLPPDTTGLALWVRPGSSVLGVGLWARIRDSAGRIMDTRIGRLEDSDWSRLTVDLTAQPQVRSRIREEPRAPALQTPLTLVSLSADVRYGNNNGGALFLGRVDALTPRGEELVHDFRSADGWLAIEDFARPGLSTLELSRSASGGEFDVSSRFSWSPGGVGMIGIRAGGSDEAMPALVSPALLDVADAEVGDTVILGMSTYSLLLDVTAEVEYFPTLDPNGRPFAVVDLAEFTDATARYSPVVPGGANELWLAGDGGSVAVGPVTAALREEGVSVREALDAPSMVALRVEQPLVAAGWGALLVLLFLAVAVASACGLMLFSHLDARERQIEFALLRTLGISRGQMQRIVWSNLLLMVLCGVALGTWLGWLIGSSLLPLMEVVEQGARATPSLVFTTDWRRLVVSYVIMAAVTGFCGLWLTWLTGKLQLQQVLRMGD